MNNSQETVELSLLPPVSPDSSVEDSPEVSSDPEKYPNRFKPGQSGNPSGRPKRTEEEKEAMEKIRSLAPRAAEEMENILRSKTASLYAKIQVIDIILSRTYGKPETALKLETVQQSVEASQDRINSLVEKIRAGKGMIS